MHRAAIRRYLILGTLALLILASTGISALPCEEGENVLCSRTCNSTFPKHCNTIAAATEGCLLLSSGSGCINGPFPVCNCSPGL